MAAVTIHSDYRSQENKICHCFHFSPHLYTMKWWEQMLWLSFWILSFKPAFFILLFHLHQEFSSSLLSAVRVVSPAYPRLLIHLLAILIPACNSSSPAFCMICFACKLDKQYDNTSFPILNHSFVPCLVLVFLFDLHTSFSGGK